jgi:cytochrome c peroxidase
MPYRTQTFLVLAVCTLLMTGWKRSGSQYADADLPASSEALGEKLFNDPILSSDRTISCASCHKPALAFADNLPLSVGVGGKFTKRNTPSAMYLTKRSRFFWDGRAASLEEQALQPIANPDEMNLPIPEAVKRLRADPFYAAAFRKVYKANPTAELLAKAMADFQITLAPYNSAYDRYLNGDTKAMSKAAVRGMELFLYDAGCVFCHLEPNFENNDFFNIGLYNGKSLNDPGRFAISGDSTHLGTFSTASLRNVALTAPYMHDGSLKTLREVLDFYNNPDSFVQGSINRHPNLRPLNLTKRQLDDLEQFLLTLTDERLAPN